MNDIPSNDVCPWCSELIFPGQLKVASDGDWMHIDCAAEDEDNAFFDRDMGDSA